jgi:glycosyltransferase involved in cell wall biosynthesis
LSRIARRVVTRRTATTAGERKAGVPTRRLSLWLPATTLGPVAGAAFDIVIPCYGERLPALQATLGACLNQATEANSIWVVDDASPDPIRRESLPADDRIHLIRFEINRGISAARMAGIGQSQTEYIACVNVDVLPATDWAETCLGYLRENAGVGAVFTRLEAANRSMVTRWRMRFQEEKYDRAAGQARFAPGHAVFFRRRAIDDVGGYDLSLRRVGEDADISKRILAAGWGIHFVARASCVSIQHDTLPSLGRKQLIRHGFYAAGSVVPGTVVRRAISTLTSRLARNVLRGRILFMPIDLAVFALELVYLRRELRRARN